MSGDEATPVPVVVEAAPALGDPMDIMTALQLVLKKSLASGGLDQPDFVKLVKALCADHDVKLITVPSAKLLESGLGYARSTPRVMLERLLAARAL